MYYVAVMEEDELKRERPHHYNASQLACCRQSLRRTPCHEQDRVQMTCLVTTQAHQAV